MKVLLYFVDCPPTTEETGWFSGILSPRVLTSITRAPSKTSSPSKYHELNVWTMGSCKHWDSSTALPTQWSWHEWCLALTWTEHFDFTFKDRMLYQHLFYQDKKHKSGMTLLSWQREFKFIPCSHASHEFYSQHRGELAAQTLGPSHQEQADWHPPGLVLFWFKVKSLFHLVRIKIQKQSASCTPIFTSDEWNWGWSWLRLLLPFTIMVG